MTRNDSKIARVQKFGTGSSLPPSSPSPSTGATMPNLLLKSLPSPTPMHDLPIYPSPTGHSSLKLKLIPSKLIYLAGERVTGMLEVGVSSDVLALGEIGIEFSAFEGESQSAGGCGREDVE